MKASNFGVYLNSYAHYAAVVQNKSFNSCGENLFLVFLAHKRQLMANGVLQMYTVTHWRMKSGTYRSLGLCKCYAFISVDHEVRSTEDQELTLFAILHFVDIKYSS